MAWTEKYVSNTIAAWANSTAYTTTPLSLVVGSDGYAYFCKLAHTSETGVKGRPTDGTDYGTYWTICDGTATKPYTWAQMVNDINAGTPSGVRYNLKADATYVLSGGAIDLTAAGPYIIQGYTTAIGDAKDDKTKRAILSNGTATTDMLTLTGGRITLRDVILVSTASTGAGDGLRIVTGTGSMIERVTAYGWMNNGIDIVGGGATLVECEAYDCNKANTSAKAGFTAAASCSLIRCVSHDHATGNNGHGFYTALTASVSFSRCVADTNAGNGFFLAQRSVMSVLSHCDAYNNGVNGFLVDNASYNPIIYLENCNAVINGADGFKTANATETMILVNCFDYNNSSGRTGDGGLLIDESSSSTYSGVPYADAPNGNFTLDNTSGEGAAGRNAARTSFMQSSASYGPTTASLDVGASRYTPDFPTAGNVLDSDTVNEASGTLTLPAEADVWYGTGAYGVAGSGSTPAMRASDITVTGGDAATLTAPAHYQWGERDSGSSCTVHHRWIAASGQEVHAENHGKHNEHSSADAGEVCEVRGRVTLY